MKEFQKTTENMEKRLCLQKEKQELLLHEEINFRKKRQKAKPRVTFQRGAPKPKSRKHHSLSRLDSREYINPVIFVEKLPPIKYK